MSRNWIILGIFVFVFHLGLTAWGQRVNFVTLSEDNWGLVPAGKEVDAVLGDYVLSNEFVIAVIARTVPGRHANMTVRDVGGCLIDFTNRARQNDQLSCFYPGAKSLRLRNELDVQVDSAKLKPCGSFVENGINWPLFEGSGREISVKFSGRGPGFDVELTYRLGENDEFLTVETCYSFDDPSSAGEISDSLRADRTFEFGMEEQPDFFFAYDSWFHQAYGFTATMDDQPLVLERSKSNRSVTWSYRIKNADSIKPGSELTIQRRLFVASNRFGLHDQIQQVQSARSNNTSIENEVVVEPAMEQQSRRVEVCVIDPTGAVSDALVTLLDDEGKPVRVSRTPDDGRLFASLPIGKHRLRVEAPHRPEKVQEFQVDSDTRQIVVEVLSTGFVDVSVEDDEGRPLPCKVQFIGVEGTADPNFGPDSRANSCRNVAYMANGRLRQPVGPGEYDVFVSRGPEYDAAIRRVVVERGTDSTVTVNLKRVVDSTGWISTDFHSHSTPSGDNTSDQLGRVLNLLAENIEFAPCTEHNRVDSYSPHLRNLDAEPWMATCSGMELTGGPLPLNHQNAFPMKYSPMNQDGGGPVTDKNPVRQIKRLKMWDEQSEKLVQINHPNLITMNADRNADGKADKGFPEMFDFVDVIEVHPPADILKRETELPRPGTRGNVMFNWLQLLNDGRRIPGVVNTDAHYNFHGSGWLRNYVKCSTDDPKQIDTMEIVRNCKAGRIVMSNGPFLTVSASGLNGERLASAGVGDDLTLNSNEVSLHVKVQCPNWIDINRVQIFVNGRMLKELNFTRRAHAEMFRSGTVKFDNAIDVNLPSDAHLIVAAVGEGLKLGKVMGPDHGPDAPIAVSNPIWVDVEGNGFQVNRDRLGAPFLNPVHDE